MLATSWLQGLQQKSPLPFPHPDSKGNAGLLVPGLQGARRVNGGTARDTLSLGQRTSSPSPSYSPVCLSLWPEPFMTWNRARPWLILPDRQTGLEEIKIPSSFCLKYLTFRNSSGFQSNPTEKIRKIKYQLEFLCEFVYRNLFPKSCSSSVCWENGALVWGRWAVGWLKGNLTTLGLSLGIGSEKYHKGWGMEVEMYLRPCPLFLTKNRHQSSVEK